MSSSAMLLTRREEDCAVLCSTSGLLRRANERAVCCWWRRRQRRGRRARRVCGAPVLLLLLLLARKDGRLPPPRLLRSAPRLCHLPRLHCLTNRIYTWISPMELIHSQPLLLPSGKKCMERLERGFCHVRNLAHFRKRVKSERKKARCVNLTV